MSLVWLAISCRQILSTSWANKVANVPICAAHSSRLINEPASIVRMETERERSQKIEAGNLTPSPSKLIGAQARIRAYTHTQVSIAGHRNNRVASASHRPMRCEDAAWHRTKNAICRNRYRRSLVLVLCPLNREITLERTPQYSQIRVNSLIAGYVGSLFGTSPIAWYKKRLIPHPPGSPGFVSSD